MCIANKLGVSLLKAEDYAQYLADGDYDRELDLAVWLTDEIGMSRDEAEAVIKELPDTVITKKDFMQAILE